MAKKAERDKRQIMAGFTFCAPSSLTFNKIWVYDVFPLGLSLLWPAWVWVRVSSCFIGIMSLLALSWFREEKRRWWECQLARGWSSDSLWWRSLNRPLQAWISSSAGFTVTACLWLSTLPCRVAHAALSSWWERSCPLCLIKRHAGSRDCTTAWDFQPWLHIEEMRIWSLVMAFRLNPRFLWGFPRPETS